MLQATCSVQQSDISRCLWLSPALAERPPSLSCVSQVELLRGQEQSHDSTQEDALSRGRVEALEQEVRDATQATAEALEKLADKDEQLQTLKAEKVCF